MQWEYLFVTINMAGLVLVDPHEDEWVPLDVLGEEGWEMVSVMWEREDKARVALKRAKDG